MSYNSSDNPSIEENIPEEEYYSSSVTRTSSQIENAKPTTHLDIKWGMPIIMLSWDMIQKIITATYIANGINMFYAIMLMYAAIRTKINIGTFINWVTENDGTTIPLCLGLSGFFSLCLSVGFVVITFFSCKNFNNETYNNILFGLIIFDIALVILLFSLAIFCVIHSYTFHNRVGSGILEKMNYYKSDVNVKIQIDTLQIKFQCCGSMSYNEWFDIPWVDTTLADEEVDEKMRDDTPFSCCSVYAHYPCIHHSLMSVGTAYVYAPETNLSVYEKGCQPALVRITRNIAWKSFLALLFLCIFQVLVGSGHRLLQTAHMELYGYEKNNFWHTGWIIGIYRGHLSQQKPPQPPPIPDDIKY